MLSDRRPNPRDYADPIAYALADADWLRRHPRSERIIPPSSFGGGFGQNRSAHHGRFIGKGEAEKR